MEIKERTVAEILLNELFKQGIKYIFLVPGTQISPILKILFKKNKSNLPEPVVANHELAAGFMATGYARASGKIGFAVSIGGPGAAYMVGAAVTAKADFDPVLFLTGNVPDTIEGTGEFQDAGTDGSNDSAIFKEAVGESIVCKKPEDITELFRLLELSFNKTKPLHAQCSFNFLESKLSFESIKPKHVLIQKEIPELICFKNERTILVIGRNAINKTDREKFKEFVKRTKTGVITDIKSRGIIPEDYEEAIGFIGCYSSQRSITALDSQSDLSANNIITVGVNNHLIKRHISHSDKNICSVDPEVFNSWMDSVSIDEEISEKNNLWLKKLGNIPLIACLPSGESGKFRYFDLIQILEKTLPEDTIYCLDSGQIRIAGSIYLTCRNPGNIIQSDNISPMGFGICASIGAQLASPGKRVVALVGDGSMRMHGFEISTSVRYNLPVIFILCDNQSYLSVRASKEAKDLSEIDWIAFGKSLGVKSFRIDNKDDFIQKLNAVLELNEPVFFWLKIPGLIKDELMGNTNVTIKNWYSEL